MWSDDDQQEANDGLYNVSELFYPELLITSNITETVTTLSSLPDQWPKLPGT